MSKRIVDPNASLPNPLEELLRISPHTHALMEKLARNCGVKIPPDIETVAWSLPILWAMGKKISSLENRIKTLEITNEKEGTDE